MIRFLSRILDRNKPLFVFNTRLNYEEEGDGPGTPSFSMITLIHENDWKHFKFYIIKEKVIIYLYFLIYYFI